MKLVTRKRVIISTKRSLMALAVIATPVALAQDMDTGWYGGLNVGKSYSDFDNSRIVNDQLRGSSVNSVTGFEDDERDIGYKIFGGYQFNRYFALEGGYFDLGQFDFTAQTQPAGTLAGQFKVRGLNLDLVGIAPLTDKFSVFARAGANYAEVRDRFSGSGAVNVLDASPDKHDTNYKYGAGLEYAFTRALSMRLEAERYRIDDAVGNDADIDLTSLGLVYRFGMEPGVVAQVPVAEPVRSAPPPAAPPAPQRVTFSADSLFDFDSATIKPAGRQELDSFAANLKSTNYDSIAVTGHTDRIGSHDYNMRLSQERADAVKDYMVQAGVPSGKISARGIDGAEPVTRPGDCTGTRKTQALIDCLQPDRRVEVEVSGTRK